MLSISSTLDGMNDELERIDEKIYTNGDELFLRFLNAIHEARSSIDIETYIFDEDQLGQAVLDALVAATKRGVRVRLLLDGVGASNWTYSEALKYQELGLQIRFFHPLPWQKHFRKIWQSLTFRRFLLGFRKLNRRTHSKLWMIDDEIAFIGSTNISARHLHAVFKEKAWRDTTVEIRQTAMASLHGSFNHAWNYSAHFFTRGNTRKHHDYYEHVIKTIRDAQHRIWITTPYFIPNRRLFYEILQAADRGVDVKMLFPEVSDFFAVKFAMEGYYQRLLKKGIQIFEYLPSMLHAKVQIIDSCVIIGSSNLDHRSLFHDLETDLVLRATKTVIEVSEQFLQDLNQSKEITLALWQKRPLINRLLEKLFLLFRSIL